MSQKLPFHASGDTVTIAATTVGTTNYAISVDGSAAQVMVTNSSSECGLVNFGSSTVAAAWPTTGSGVTGYVIPPNGTVFLTPGKAAYAAGVYGSTSNSFYITPGSGGS